MRSSATAILAAALFAGCSPQGGGTSAPSPGAAPSLSVAHGPLPVAQLGFPDGTGIAVELASTPKDREYGLMNRTSLPPDYGMLFVFPQEQTLQFWMKNTLVDLDMVFIGADKAIRNVYADVPRSAPDAADDVVARRTGSGLYVLELPAGAAARHHLSQGQTLTFSAPIPPL